VTGGAASGRQRALARRCRAALDAVLAACRAGATGGDLVAAWASCGEPLPAVPLAHGVGLGVEPPIIGAGVGAASALAPDTVLAVTAWVAEEGVGGFLERDLVLVTAGDPRVLTTSGRGPAGEAA
jgi:Xaa-Pro aminopeptidase